MDNFFDEPMEEGTSIDFMRYIRGLIKRWWLIAGFMILGMVFGYLKVKDQKPLYEATAWISFDNIQGAIPDHLIRNRIAKLRSRAFAEEATAKLGLTLVIPQKSSSRGLLREDVFLHFATDRNPVSGEYQLHFNETGNCHIYYNTDRIDTRTIQSCLNDTIALNGLHFTLNPEIINKHDKIYFQVKDFQSTVRNLIAKEKIRPTPDGSLMMIVLQDGNPKIAAKTVNLMADLFIQKSEYLRRDATKFNREYLEEQLQLVNQDLNKSDFQLKSFRTTYLQGLDQETQETVDRVNRIQTQINEINFQKKELALLLNKLDPTHDSFDQTVPIEFIYREIGGHPAFVDDSEMKITRDGLNNLIRQKNDLMGKGFPERNPEVENLSDNIILSQEKIHKMATEKLVELDKSINQMNIDMNAQQQKLAKLPEDELRFIRLNRDRRANEKLHENLLSRLKGATINEEISMERVSIMDPAVPNFKPVNADKKKVFIIWVIGFMFGGLGMALVLEMADKSVRSSDDVSHHLRLKILGSIPKVKFDSYELQDSEKAKSISSQIVTHDYSPTPVGESYRALRTSLLFSKSIGTIHTLVISSAAPGEGKSFTAANLTITMAQQKSKTLLVDADLRRGVLHNTFNCQKKPGLTNYLTGVASLEDVLQETYIPNLSLIACGSMIPNPSELLGSERMQKFVAGISKRFDMVVFDTPPLLAASDAVILGTLVDGVAVVVRSGQTHRDTIKRKLELFQNVQARVLGGILNCAGVEVAHEGYSYYSY